MGKYGAIERSSGRRGAMEGAGEEEREEVWDKFQWRDRSCLKSHKMSLRSF